MVPRAWLLLLLGACASGPSTGPVEHVGRRVDAVRRELGLCYHAARLEGAQVRGADFVVAIDFAASPPDVRVRDAEGLDEGLLRCVLGVLRAVDFPAVEPSTIDVPIRAPR